jgi:ADP-heptose:LPS heptosyltransferase
MTDESILIFRIGSLGDTVVALPCFHRIARSFPTARRILVTDVPTSQKVTSVESVLGTSGLIDDVIYFPPPPRRMRDILTLRRQIRATKATKLIYVADRRISETLRDMCFFLACGIRSIVGAPLSRDLRKLRVDANGDTEREAARLARRLAALGPIDIDDPSMWDLRLQPDEIAVAERELAPLHGRRFAVIAPAAKWPTKDWGFDNWSMLLRSMNELYSDLALVFVGSDDESARCAALQSGIVHENLNLCGKLTPRQSAAVMRGGIFFLGHDSGPMHLAAAVGMPCVAIFGRVNMPKWWYPVGEQHRVLHDRTDIRGTSPAAVLDAVASVLAEHREPAARASRKVAAKHPLQ